MGGIQFGIYKLPDTIAQINGLVTEISEGLIDLENQLTAKIEAIKIVNSVQRGVMTTSTATGNKVVAIATVDPSKCMVILDSSYDDDYGHKVRLESITENELTIRVFGVSPKNHHVSWQVIEFC